MPSQKFGIATPADRDHRRRVVDRLAAPDRRGDARGHADQNRQDPRREAELQGHESPAAELLRHRAHVLRGAAEVALQDVAEPDQVLDDDRLVEVVTLPDELQLLFVERLAGADERPRRVARDREHQREHQERDEEEDGHRLQQATSQIVAHTPSSPWPKRARRREPPDGMRGRSTGARLSARAASPPARSWRSSSCRPSPSTGRGCAPSSAPPRTSRRRATA